MSMCKSLIPLGNSEKNNWLRTGLNMSYYQLEWKIITIFMMSIYKHNCSETINTEAIKLPRH